MILVLSMKFLPLVRYGDRWVIILRRPLWLILNLVLFIVPVPLRAVTLDSALPGWTLVWSDEFEGGSLETATDASGWEVAQNRDSHNNEKQYYRGEQVSVENGNLRITATNEPISGKRFRSGKITTWQEWSYGRFEARAKLPTTQGMWPAFWLNSRGAHWPAGGEIDIMENRGSEPFKTSSAYHWGQDFSVHRWVTEEFLTAQDQPNVHESFHKYAAEWAPGVIRYFVDDHLYHTVTDDKAPIHETPKSIILNLAVGGDFGGDPDDTTKFPQVFEVDYVRVWQPAGEKVVRNVNGSFEYLDDPLTGWNRFNSVDKNISIVAAPEREKGSHALKLTGQNSQVLNWSGVSQGIRVVPGTRLRASVSSYVSSDDSLKDADDFAELKLEFYQEFGGKIHSEVFLRENKRRIADNQSPLDQWTQDEIVDTVPAGAVEARLTIVFLQSSGQSGSVHVDRALLESLPE